MDQAQVTSSILDYKQRLQNENIRLPLRKALAAASILAILPTAIAIACSDGAPTPAPTLQTAPTPTLNSEPSLNPADDPRPTATQFSPPAPPRLHRPIHLYRNPPACSHRRRRWSELTPARGPCSWIRSCWPSSPNTQQGTTGRPASCGSSWVGTKPTFPERLSYRPRRGPGNGYLQSRLSAC